MSITMRTFTTAASRKTKGRRAMKKRAGAVYALLGSSRVLTVSSTATLSILVGAQLGVVVPDGDPAKLLTTVAATHNF